MDKKPLQEVYDEFLSFTQEETRRERSLMNRRMFSVFLWCFLLPAVVAITLLILVSTGVLPYRVRANLDWILLLFPVFYSLYVLGSEVLVGVPQAFRSGNLGSALRQVQTESQWRGRICAEMERRLDIGNTQWAWIAEAFKMDLEQMKQRARYLTGLAGSVFFLILQGMDYLSENPETVSSLNRDGSQFIGLTLFLVLLYLSGMQTHHSLERYRSCAELLSLRTR